MSENYKERVMKAIEKNHQRVLDRDKPKIPTRKNQSPEKDLTEKPCVSWMKSKGWRVTIIEAKATFSESREAYTSSSVKSGTLDCNATDPHGFSCWIEFKAPGKLKKVWDNQKQVDFIKEEIAHNAFSCVVDSPELLAEIYQGWIKHRKNGHKDKAQKYLLARIPEEPKRRDGGELF